ncbi:S-adenosyl-L-methionine-dependent methyltransferase [Lasiosphaeria hispida]|uniref:S-adenosyl-L-methionine-dependent methyltransferase n=1 Tax=Lasiosphaeria hispida TaxID=260671 RepID=A0AAJ0MF28_9PEZI|nr:S-adenosyl-L-methionine-dependent methyltransferase [Lasiosphaeria hispida]
MNKPASPASPKSRHQTTEALAIAIDTAFDQPVRDDSDSSPLGESESLLESTASLSSTIFNYRKVHGRTFPNFKDAEYWAPNDEKQNEGLDLHHHMTLLFHNDKLHVAPLKNPQNVLDIGTGTGIWAIDFADEYPSAIVTGTDISPIQPPWAPPNCKFELDDASLEWTFADNSFDYIHITQLIGCIEDWPKLYRQAYRCLKPGGWIEHTDFTVRVLTDDNSVPKDDPYKMWNQFFEQATEKTGRSFHLAEENKLADWLKESGFPSVQVENYRVPIGHWPAERKWKDVGLYSLAGFLQGLEGYCIFLGTEVLGWHIDELRVFFAKMRTVMTNPKVHAYYPAVTAYGQKPPVS